MTKSSEDRVLEMLVERIKALLPASWQVTLKEDGILQLIATEDVRLEATTHRLFDMIREGKSVKEAIDIMTSQILNAIAAKEKQEKITRDDLESHARVVLGRRQIYLTDKVMRESLLFDIIDDEICVLYVIDHPDFIITLSNRLMQNIHLNKEEVSNIAYRNMERIYRSQGKWERLSVDVPVKIHALMMGRENKDYTSSFAVLECAWEDARKAANHDNIIGIIPTRDLFLICRDNPFNRKVMADMAEFLVARVSSNQKSVSERIWKMKGGKLESILAM